MWCRRTDTPLQELQALQKHVPSSLSFPISIIHISATDQNNVITMSKRETGNKSTYQGHIKSTEADFFENKHFDIRRVWLSDLLPHEPYEINKNDSLPVFYIC